MLSTASTRWQLFGSLAVYELIKMQTQARRQLHHSQHTQHTRSSIVVVDLLSSAQCRLLPKSVYTNRSWPCTLANYF